MADDPSRPTRAGTGGPVLFEIDGPTPPDRPAGPADAPPVPDPLTDRMADGDAAPTGRAMQTLALLGARRGRSLAGWFWASAGALLVFALSVGLWAFVAELLAARPWLGWVALALTTLFVLVCLAIVVRELAALSRLRRIDDLRHRAEAAVSLADARDVADRVAAFYAGRPDTAWGRAELARGRDDVFDADALVALTERSLLASLDAAAAREVEAAARQVALVTAVVPLALADVVAALTANLRMIRRIATIYGGRAGTVGSWRLARAVFAHLAATGAVAVGDDLIQSIAGGGALARLSRRFGEGVVNGALTARVGRAAMEVCRPLPFHHLPAPRSSALVGRALTGLFDRKE